MQPGFERGQLIWAGLDEEHGFGGRLNLALPEIEGLDGGNLRDAGGEALLDQRKGKPAGLFRVGHGGENDAGWWVGFCHGHFELGNRFSNNCSPKTAAPPHFNRLNRQFGEGVQRGQYL